MISIYKVEPKGPNSRLVTVVADSRPELTSMDARNQAVAAATQEIGMCSFEKYANYGYYNPPDAQCPEGRFLTDEELMTPGVKKSNGRHTLELVITARM